MKPDSLAFINVSLPAGSLPLSVLIVLLIGTFAIIGLLIVKASGFKVYAADFPTQTAPMIVGLGAFLLTLPVILSRMALGMAQMDGTGEALAAELALAGVGVAGLGVKRFSSPEYHDGKAKVEAAKAQATPPQVNVQGGANINATSEQPIPVAVPQAGIRPSNPAVAQPLEALAAKQREDDEGII